MLIAVCRAAGWTHIVSCVDTFNVASLRADAKVGYDKVVRLTMWRFMGLGFLRFLTGRPLGPLP